MHPFLLQALLTVDFDQGITKKPTAGVTWMAGKHMARGLCMCMRGCEIAEALGRPTPGPASLIPH